MPIPQKEKKRAGRKGTKLPFSKEALTIGSRIRKIRGEKPLTKVEADLNISNQALSNIERGLTNPGDPRTKRTLQSLASYYKHSFGLSWLEPFAARGSVSAAPPQSDLLTRLPAGLLDKGMLQAMSDEDKIDYLHVIKDALKEIEKYLEGLIKK